ncbi:putative integral membrane protein [Theileria parva strain Muguga]|uniref:GPI transamidase component GPI16 n=1 Tax=Theileria parva TaxID=5875 RepID=Q4N622_THEPA|nr:putative integral membrane protein [Theileria parva strain Muguga]EAN32401.1 putative integral membrane protein [Theileria parva strain Muguga]|eukprot:XP_764684.1 hypothetical protein [Theileria parva strain Muguga]
MYIIFISVICVVLKNSYCVNYYAGFTFNYSDIDSHVPILGSFYNKLYFFYSNTLVNNGEKKFDYTYHQLDNIHSGLSLFTDSVYDLDKIPGSTKNKHLLGTLESWCYTLTLFLFYPKFSNDIAYKDGNVYNHLFDRCMNLNSNFTNYRKDFDFVEFLNNTDTKLDDIYLFEKFSRMCPRPCYLDKDKLGNCNPSSKFSDLELLNEFVSNPKCYINDFLSYECIPYSFLKRKTVNSFKSLLNPDSNIHVYSNKYSYLYMPKRDELQLSMDDLSYQMFLKLVRNCNTKNCIEIKDLFTTMTLKNFMVKFLVGEIDLNSKNPNEKFKISFGLTFYVDEFRSKNVNHVFDFLIKNVDFDVLYDVLLGPQPLQVNNEENEKPPEEKPKSFKERYNKYIHDKLNKKVIETKPKPPISDFFSNKFEFLNMTGYGQHREVTFSMELNTELLKRLKPINSKYYFKLTHMLDTSVYIDNDELHGLFNLLKDEVDALDLPTNHVLEENGVGKVVLKALKTPFIDIEQPEMNSSPVIYNGYVVLDESVLNLRRLTITLTLNLHTRYMHMIKATTPELFKVDNFRILRNQIGTDYSLSIISQPKLYILNPFTPFENVSLHRSYLRYLRFLRDISFTRFSSSDNGNKENGLNQPENTWVPVFFTQCNNVGVSAKLCQGYRTGLAISTKVINTFFCNPIIREIGGDVIDSSCYMFFSVPVGNQNEYPFIKNVTLFTLLVSCIGSLIMVLRYIDETLKNAEYTTK